MNLNAFKALSQRWRENADHAEQYSDEERRDGYYMSWELERLRADELDAEIAKAEVEEHETWLKILGVPKMEQP